MLNFDEKDVVLYFWNASCSVCGPLYDKLSILINEQFPKLELHKLNIAEHPELRAEYQVFSSPLIIFMLDGKEYFRSSGAVSVKEISSKIERLYALKFDS